MALRLSISLLALGLATTAAAPVVAQDAPKPPPGWVVTDPKEAPKPPPGTPPEAPPDTPAPPEGATLPMFPPDYPKPPREVQEARDLFNSGSYAEGFRKAFPFAQKGEPWSQNLIGMAYYYGHGVVQDCDLALKWTRLAAEQGQPFGLGNLGRHYDDGCYGENVDDAAAADYYAKADAAGFLGDNGWYALFLADGRAGPPDAARIGAVLARGIAADVWSARAAKAELQLWGRGQPQDVPAAMAFLEPAAAEGTPEAQLILARAQIDGVSGPADPAAAFALLHGLTQRGWVRAAPYEAKLRIEGGGDWADPIEGWALCIWAVDGAGPEFYNDAMAICGPLEEKVDWRDRMKATMRGALKSAQQDQ